MLYFGLIFNPVSGAGNASEDLERLCWQLTVDGDRLEVWQTTPERDATQLAIEAQKQGCNPIVAAGGDGTVAAVARPLVQTEITLGIVPRGTANAFAMALGIPPQLEAACQVIRQGTSQIVDVGLCNDRPFLLKASLGYGARTIAETSRAAKNRFGLLAYLWQGLQQLGQLQRFRVCLETANGICESRVSSLAIANASPPTSVLAQGPPAVVWDDGLLDVTLLQADRLDTAVAALGELWLSGLAQNPARGSELSHFRTNALTIRLKSPRLVVLDGEAIGFHQLLQLRCLPGALRAIVP